MIAASPISVASDWTTLLRSSDAALLRSLPFARLARIPPPKREGLPFGHELRILGRFVTGATSSLDPSAFTFRYLALLGARERLLFRALVLREAVSETEWSDLLGSALGDWTGRGLLGGAGGELRCAFSVVPVGDLLFAVDPQEQAFSGKIHLGQDSLNLLRFLERRAVRPGARVLDVGTGSGILLCASGRTARTAHGLDVNPRATRAARFNAALNGLGACVVEERDIFAPWSVERFDLAIWNAPFVFYPEAEREQNLDGYGGRFGIEITLRFVERLPELLAEGGLGVMMTAGPVMTDGEHRLETELRDRAGRLGLDVVVHVLQPFWIPRLAQFHEAHGIDHFEGVILELRAGQGRLERREPARLTRVASAARGWLYRVGRGR